MSNVNKFFAKRMIFLFSCLRLLIFAWADDNVGPRKSVFNFASINENGLSMPMNFTRDNTGGINQSGSSAGQFQKKYVVIACDSTREYAFYLPLSAQVWRLVGYEPIALLVGTDWRLGTLPWTVIALNRLAALHVATHIIDLPPRITHSTAAQLARLFAAAELGLSPLADEDRVYVLVADVDAWPLQPAHYSTRRNWSQPVHLYNAFCCGTKPVQRSGFRRTRPAFNPEAAGEVGSKGGDGTVTASTAVTDHDAIDPEQHAEWYRVYPIGAGVGATVASWREIMKQSPPTDDISISGVGARIARRVMRAMRAELRPVGMGELGRGNRGALEGSGAYRCPSTPLRMLRIW